MKKIMVLSVVAVMISGCGTSTGDRAASGALIGAGAGAAVGTIFGSPGTGAVLGGAAGAATGALVDPCSLDLGAPVWKDKQASREDYRQECGHYPK